MVNLILHCVAFISPVPDHHEFYRVGLDTVCHYDLTTPLTQEAIIFVLCFFLCFPANVTRYIYKTFKSSRKRTRECQSYPTRQCESLAGHCLGFTHWSNPSIDGLFTIVELSIRCHTASRLQWHLMADYVFHPTALNCCK